MDVLPNLIEESIFANFTSKDFEAVAGVMNDAIAKDLDNYTKNPDADPMVVDKIKMFLGNIIENFTMHFILQEKGTIELVQGLMPTNLASSGVDLDKLIEQLKYLEDNAGRLMSKMPARSKEDFDRFRDALSKTICRMNAAGTPPTRSDTLKRIDANRFVFFVPNAKPSYTGCGVIMSKRNNWMISLRGAEYLKYCQEHNISYNDRRAF